MRPSKVSKHFWDIVPPQSSNYIKRASKSVQGLRKNWGFPSIFPALLKTLRLLFQTIFKNMTQPFPKSTWGTTKASCTSLRAYLARKTAVRATVRVKNILKISITCPYSEARFTERIRICWYVAAGDGSRKCPIVKREIKWIVLHWRFIFYKTHEYCQCSLLSVILIRELQKINLLLICDTRWANLHFLHKRNGKTMKNSNFLSTKPY